ncbi:MAG: peptidoglycan D,D-transpeptidase FtsI family protein [Bacillota bacterium]
MNRQTFFLRISFLLLLFLGFLLAIEVRIAYIQLVKGTHYAVTAHKMHVLELPAENPPRGDILDRHGQSLIGKVMVTSLAVVPSMIQEPSHLAEALAGILDIPVANTLELLVASVPAKNPILLKEGLTLKEVDELRELNANGLFIVPTQQRYGSGSLARHLIGYLNKIDSQNWQSLRLSPVSVSVGGREVQKKYQRGDLVGVKGIEVIYEKYLKGTASDYSLSAVVDARGNVVKGWGFRPQSNNARDITRGDVVLTIDSRIQRIIEQVLDKAGVRGAVVVIDISSGDVLGMASRPNIDQNRLASYLMNAEQEFPLINRCLEPYFPGSIFKSVIALTAIETGQVQIKEKFECTGSYSLPSGLNISCWKKEGHGELSFEEAFASSCNPVFIEVGLRVGGLIEKYSEKLGLNQQELIGYNLPPRAIEVKLEPGPGKVANASLGQEGVRLSPLQVANLMATFGRKGIYITPRVVEKVVDIKGNPILEFSPGTPVKVISEETVNELENMLRLVTISGTGKQAWVPKWGAAGKTSTAETGRLDKSGRRIVDVWFAGYTPLDNPRLAIAVLIEDGIAGGQDAAPIFREIAKLILGR